MKNEYADMLDLPHHVSDHRRPMSMENRAAQFSPFAALVGYGDAVLETARLTDAETELDEQTLSLMDSAWTRIQKEPGAEVSVMYFVPDARKEGGHYETITGIVRDVDDFRKVLRLQGGTEIEITRIVNLEML